MATNWQQFHGPALSCDMQASDRTIEMNANSAQKTREDWLIAGMFLAGAVSFMLAFFTDSIEDPFALAWIVLVTAVCEVLSVRLYFDGRVSVSFVGVVLAAILFGPIGGVLAAAGIAMTGYVSASRNPRKLIFNFGHGTLAAAVAGWILLAMGVTGTNYGVREPLGAFV